MLYICTEKVICLILKVKIMNNEQNFSYEEPIDAISLLREQTQRLIEQMHEECESEKDLYRKYLVSGYSMLSKPQQSIDYLLHPILPRTGVAALVGTSDSGKSTLLRGLAMAVASGAKSYLSFPLNIYRRRAIYVATEDDESAISALMFKQIAELGTSSEEYSTLDFIFQTDNLLHTLDATLTERPADLVVIDAFADLYTGPMNENNRVRTFLNSFSQLAQKHSTLFLFLHHTGKRTETFAPSKHNAIGSQGFEAKMRLVMELRPDLEQHDIRHLCIVKGNYLPQQYKHDSFVLRFTEGLNFVDTGERVPFEMLRERTPEKEDERLEQMRAMRAQGMSFRQIAEAVGFKDGSTVLRKLRNNM